MFEVSWRRGGVGFECKLDPSEDEITNPKGGQEADSRRFEGLIMMMMILSGI
jgi:hypothetical protein